MDKITWPARSVLPFAQPGLKFIAIAILLTGMFFYLDWILLCILSLAASAFICWFFRDPKRQIPQEKNSLVSPADGRVILVEELERSPYLDQQCTKVSIFMNVFNVHVNRIPFDGVVHQVVYHPGKFMNASFDKASEHNERNALVIETSDRRLYVVVQIAGLIARRIVNCVVQGESVTKGGQVWNDSVWQQTGSVSAGRV